MSTDLPELEAAKRLLLAHAPDGEPISTVELFDLVTAERTFISSDTIRFAYWVLVGQGLLERVPAGVRRTSFAEGT